MSEKSQILQRRSDVKNLLVRGLSLKEISQEMQISYVTIRRDVEVIRKGIVTEIKNDGFSQTLSEFLLCHEELYRQAWIGHEQAIKQKNARGGVAYLRILSNILNDKIKVLMTLGVINENQAKKDEVITIRWNQILF